MARRWHRQTRARPTGGPARASARQRTANAGPCRQWVGGQTARQCRREPGPASNPPRARPAALRVHPVRRVRHAACGQPARRPADPPTRYPLRQPAARRPACPPCAPCAPGPPRRPGPPTQRPAGCTRLAGPTARHVYLTRRPDGPPRAPGPPACRPATCARRPAACAQIFAFRTNSSFEIQTNFMYGFKL